MTGPLEVDELNPTWLATTRGRPSLTEGPTWFGVFPIVAAGNLGIRRDVWRAAGRFDEAFSAQEDHEFALRLRLPGRAGLLRARPRSCTTATAARPRALWEQGTVYGESRPAALAPGAAARARSRRRASPGGARGPGCSCTSSISAPSTGAPRGSGSRRTGSASCAGCVRYRTLFL